MRSLAARIVACRRCPRLIAHCRRVAREKRRAYAEWVYWGRPVPPFGARSPKLLVVGLAPGAHGANRTGRIFTGDASGDWLFAALHASGFANRAESVRRGDGLALAEARVTCAARCAPPGNRPTPRELTACRPFLAEELRDCRRVRAIVALGRIALDSVVRAWADAGRAPISPRPLFRHGAEYALPGGVRLLVSYHPSRQNTQTGRLTGAMLRKVFRRARKIVGR